MKKIKYYEQFLRESSYDPKYKDQAIDVDGIKFYHGTVYEIKGAKDLDPLFREKIEYKKNQEDNLTKSHSASAKSGGVGIYFGRTADTIASEDAKQYYDPNTYSGRKYTKGFMYEMTFKPGSKVIWGPDYVVVGKEEYESMRADGIDAISEYPNNVKNGGGLVLLNPDAVQTWKEIKRWEQPFDIVLSKYNPDLAKAEATWKPGDALPPETIEVERKRFWDYDEMNDYVKKYLGKDAPYSTEGNLWDKDENYCISIMRPKLTGFE